MTREEAISHLQKTIGWQDDDITAIIMAIEALERPEQKKGKWICHDIREGFLVERYTCSICDYDNGTQKFNYCPHCGAKMEGEENENKS